MADFLCRGRLAEQGAGKEEGKEQAVAYRDLVVTAMAELREDADALETLVDAEYWPMPSYTELLFNI